MNADPETILALPAAAHAAGEIHHAIAPEVAPLPKRARPNWSIVSGLMEDNSTLREALGLAENLYAALKITYAERDACAVMLEARLQDALARHWKWCAFCAFVGLLVGAVVGKVIP
jgi:hypothetical protein